MAETKTATGSNIFSKIFGSRLFRTVFFLLIFFLAAFFSQLQINRLQPKAFSPDPEKTHNPMLIRLLSSGFNQLAADLYWVKTLLILKGKVTPEDGPGLRQVFDVVVTLDPWFYPAYFHGGLILSTRAGNPGFAHPFLERGIQAFPQDWQIPFLLGWNSYRELRDFPGAVRWMRESAASPEAPAWLAELRPEFLRLAENQPLLSTDFPALAERVGGEWGRTYWGRQQSRLIILRDLEMLNRLAVDFQKKFNMAPGSLDELKWNGLLAEIPVHPLGGNYFIDAKKKKIYSSVN